MTSEIDRLKAGMFKALGHPLRIQIVELLTGGERSVADLIARTGAEASHLSQQLGVLRKAGVLVSRREASTVFYWIRDPRTPAPAGHCQRDPGDLAHRESGPARRPAGQAPGDDPGAAVGRVAALRGPAEASSRRKQVTAHTGRPRRRGVTFIRVRTSALWALSSSPMRGGRRGLLAPPQF
ncbi:MAG TPA: metalloregulator ArsR/SmtB family transcription factor [Actinomycetota bacterium]|nr:metalloregulator ArsR/SmtB family transcription factor [Actinomycetota bacterium]